jgi:hypothetical protein
MKYDDGYETRTTEKAWLLQKMSIGKRHLCVNYTEEKFEHTEFVQEDLLGTDKLPSLCFQDKVL